MHRPTINIIIPAYNEAHTIKDILHDCLHQNLGPHSIDSIIIISDGSTDSTADNVRSLNDSRIKLEHYSERAGKAVRLNSAYKNHPADILINLDADIRLKDPNVLLKLILPLVNDQKCSATCGNPVPYEPKNFVERSTHLGYELFEYALSQLQDKSIRYRFNGRIFATRGEALHSIKIPGDCATDTYTFYHLITKGSVIFIPESVVFYRLPKVSKDYIRQKTRYLRTNIENHFPRSLTHSYETIAIGYKIKAMIFIGIWHPILLLYFLGMNIVSKFKSFTYIRTARWDVSPTTKERIKKI